MQVIMPRYRQATNLAAQLPMDQFAAQRIALIGVLVLLQNEETVKAEDFREAVGDDMYAALVENVRTTNEHDVCLLVEVEHAEEPKIVRSVGVPAGGVGGPGQAGVH